MTDNNQTQQPQTPRTLYDQIAEELLSRLSESAFEKELLDDVRTLAAEHSLAIEERVISVLRSKITGTKR